MAKTKNGLSPLHMGREATVMAKTKNGLSPLHIGREATVMAKTKNGLSPLHMAIQGDHSDCARLLLLRHADINDVTVVRTCFSW